jgi:hypothetical protein
MVFGTIAAFAGQHSTLTFRSIFSHLARNELVVPQKDQFAVTLTGWLEEVPHVSSASACDR